MKQILFLIFLFCPIFIEGHAKLGKIVKALKIKLNGLMDELDEVKFNLQSNQSILQSNLQDVFKNITTLESKQKDLENGLEDVKNHVSTYLPVPWVKGGLGMTCNAVCAQTGRICVSAKQSL